MKTFMKKLLTLLIAVCLLLSTALFNVGCDGVLTEPVELIELMGTYHLTEFTKFIKVRFQKSICQNLFFQRNRLL